MIMGVIIFQANAYLGCKHVYLLVTISLYLDHYSKFCDFEIKIVPVYRDSFCCFVNLFFNVFACSLEEAMQIL